MRLAFVTNHSSSDLNDENSHTTTWSGTIFNMRRALERSELDVETIDLLRDPYSALFRTKRMVKNIVFRKNYLRDREPLTLKSYARQIESFLGQIKPDVVFSPGTIPIAYLRTDIPIVFWTDATFDGMIDFYPEFTNLCEETLRNGRQMEQAALSSCRLAIFASEWAAKTAIENYNVDNSKVKVVPFGANLAPIPDPDKVQRAIASRGSGVCKLLFVGVDWHRKGGDKALAVTSMLNQRGLKAELHVVGCTPPSLLPGSSRTYGYLSKNNDKQKELLSRLYLESDFLILPSEAESFGIVIAEANAFGLPALTTNVGGIGTVVRNGKNGRAFEARCFVQECTEYILQTSSSKERYHQLCVSSFEEYSKRLNWDSAVQSVLHLMTSAGLMQSPG
jgi:glycosyltransferase involved in cell wall biosynthesis